MTRADGNPTARRLSAGAATMLLLLAIGSALLAPSAVAQAPAPTTAAPAAASARSAKARLLSQARSWGYQLQQLNVDELSASPCDVLVIDYSRDGSDEGKLQPADLARLRRKPDGSPRIVLAYMSVGEAETYRFYWKWTWGGRWFTDWIGFAMAPRWLRSANVEWGGNYAVRYWDPRWQAIIIGPQGYLQRILDAGFDGVWLDKIDSSLEKVARTQPTAIADMRELVGRIAARGRAARPGFLVVPQNGDELLTDAAYRATIDGIGKEDLLYGEFSDKQPNPAEVVARRVERLKRLTAEGRPVLAVEYIDQTSQIEAARRTLTELGFIAHFADRELDALRIGDSPASRGGAGRHARRLKSWRNGP